MSASTIGDDVGPPISKKRTVMLFHIVQLELFRNTVTQRGDHPFPQEPMFERDYQGLHLAISTIPGRRMSVGQVLYGLQRILYSMLFNQEGSRGAGFFARNWSIGLANSPGPFGIVRLLIHSPGDQLSATAQDSAYTKAFPADLDAPENSSTTTALTVPFPIPESDTFLLFGARGVDLPLESIVWPVLYLISVGWQKVATNPLRPRVGKQAVEDQSRTVLMRLLPRMDGSRPLTTASDMVESAIGIVYYMLQHGFFATTINIVRPEASAGGRRVPVGEIKVGLQAPRIDLPAAKNGSFVGTQ